MRSIRSGSGAAVVDALDIVTLERMRFELRFPDGDHQQDPMLIAQIRGAASFVSIDAGIDLGALSADDERLPAFASAIVVAARTAYDGAVRMPVAYEMLIRPLRVIL